MNNAIRLVPVAFVAALLLPSPAALRAADITFELAESAKVVSVGVYDADGTLVRTLLAGEEQEAGKHSITWDGLDRSGRPVVPGKYEWRLFTSGGLKAEYLLALGTSPDWPAYEGWIGNHGGTAAVALDDQGNVYCGAEAAEGPPFLLKMSADGKQKLWSAEQYQVSQGAYRLAVIGDTLYVMQPDRKLIAVSTADGRNRSGYLKAFYDSLFPGDVAWDWQMGPKTKVTVGPMDMEAVDGQLAISYHDHHVIRFLSVTDRHVTREVKIDSPGALAVGADGRLFIACQGQIVRLDPGADQVKRVVQDVELKSPIGMTFERVSGDLIVALDASDSQHLRRYHDGTLLRTYGRKAGRQWGAFHPDDFRGLRGVQADRKGGFFTIEATPRRIAHFTGDSTLPDREWFGSVHWGAGLAIDPEDPSVAYFEMEDGQFMRAKLDFKTRRWALTHIYERLKYPEPVEMLYLRWRVMRHGGRTYLVSWGNNVRTSPFVIEVLDGGARLQMASFLGRSLQIPRHDWWLEAAKRDGFVEENSWVGMSWVDANGDGKIQSDEVGTHKPVGWGMHVWLDKDWNVYVAGSDKNVDAGGRAVLWYVIPNRAARAEDTPNWDWKDARPVKAEVPDEFRRWQFPEMAGIAAGDDGSVYQITRPTYRVGITPQERDNKEERHGNGWPHSYSAVVRIFKWRPDGSLEWAIGKKANDKTHEQPGELACPVAFLGFAGDKFFIHDRAGRITTAWTTDGLAAGYVFDRHADDGLPADRIYRVTGSWQCNYLMGDDHVIQNFDLARDGQIYWSTPAVDAAALYRIHDWQGGARKSGVVEINSPAPAARLRGSGLKAEYFAAPDLTGAAAMTRVDDQVWFRGLYLSFTPEIKARPFFTKNSPVPQDSFSARWTGEVEPRFSEDYRFVVYTDGDDGLTPPPGEKVRLWIGNQLVLDHWEQVKPHDGGPRTATYVSGSIPLTAGTRTSIRLEFSAKESKVPHLHLCWESRTQDREHVPATALYPAK
jgi:hypothetical protein